MKIDLIEEELKKLDIDCKSLRNLTSIFLNDLKNTKSFNFRVGKRETKNTISCHIGFLKNGTLIKIFLEKC